MQNGTTINRNNEVNIIGYQIPDSMDIIIAKHGGVFIIKSNRRIEEYTREELEKAYNLNLKQSDLERLTWTA